MKQSVPGRAGRRWFYGFVAGCVILAGCAHPDPTRLRSPEPPGRTSPEPPRRTSQNDPYQQFGKWYTPITDSAGFSETGIASWYGNEFHGKKTSSGEVYNMYDMTAAHKTLPLGTYVNVTHLKTGRSEIVRINDRGPFVEGRIIDLSYLAASKLGVAAAGTGRVAIAALDRDYREARPDEKDLAATLPDDAGQTAYTLQTGSFTSRQNAESLRKSLGGKYDKAYIAVFHDGAQTFYRVRVGRYATREAGEKAMQAMKMDGFENITLVTE